MGRSKVKKLPVSARDVSLIPGWGRSPGGGNGNPLQHSCLNNPMETGAWWATVHSVAELDTAEHKCNILKFICVWIHSGHLFVYIQFLQYSQKVRCSRIYRTGNRNRHDKEQLNLTKQIPIWAEHTLIADSILSPRIFHSTKTA